MKSQPKKSIKLALQGGGSHGAFAWGVLDRLLEDERLHIAAVSGTSAGAMNAVALADGMARGGPAEARKCLEKFWSATSAAAQYSPIRRSFFDIFISHSSKDTEVAAAIGERIRRERPTWSLFYDKDNIRAGQRWQERLREELTSCRVVLALLSRNWLGSPWCFTEAVTATFRGKDVIGIETEDLTTDDLARAPPILHERQRVRLREGDDRPWQEILEALDRSGLDPDDWFRHRGDKT